MEQTMKERVIEAVERLKNQGKSQNQIAAIAGVSSANISLMLQRKWESISPELWRKVQKNLSVGDDNWQQADIWNYKKVQSTCLVAHAKSVAKLLTYDAGFGKSFALRSYASENANAVYLQCERHWTRRVFLQKFGQAIGISSLAGSVSDMIDDISERLKKMQKPIVIWDEFDKVLEKQGVFDLFKTFYDATEGHCGFVLCGTPALENTLRRKVQAQKIGYVELFSRCGRSFETLRPLSKQDIGLVCKANGVATEAVNGISLELGTQGDLRQLRALIENYRIKQEVRDGEL